MLTAESMVSVLMGVRNGGMDLAPAVDSILSQSFDRLEFIICDDGSTDGTPDLLARYAVQDDRVRLLRNETSRGLAAALNQCLRLARGRYIARMDADDFSFPQRLEKQLAYLEVHPDLAFLGCVSQLKRDGKSAGIRRLPARPVVKDFLFVQPFLHPTLIFRREVLEAVGGYCEESRCLGCEDYDLLLRLYGAGYRGENLQEPLFTYTLPPVGSKKRTMALRWNEVKTRYVRFRALGLLPGAIPYVVKPVVVGLVPEHILSVVKSRHTQGSDKGG